MNTIGATIKKLRSAKGITQEELAEAVNISYQAVSKWENGGSPDLDMLPILANYFGVSIDELMGFKLAAATATILANKYGLTLNYCSDRKVPDSRGRTICGHTLEDGERIVIVDDLINSGKTVAGRIQKLKEIADVKVVALVAIVDRGDGAAFMKKEYGAQTLTVISGEDIDSAIKRGIV